MARPADEAEIRRVLAAYCRGVDRRDWALVRDCYHDDAHEDHGIFRGSPDEFVRWLEERHAHGMPSMHFLGNIYIEIDGDAAFSESYAITIQQVEGVDSPMLATGGCRYVDRFERRQGEWRIAARTMVVEFMRPPVPAADVPGGFATGERSRGDFSYDVLAAIRGG